jgi:hypothetical protein
MLVSLFYSKICLHQIDDLRSKFRYSTDEKHLIVYRRELVPENVMRLNMTVNLFDLEEQNRRP